MGATAVALNYSAWGKQSGAHYNPAVDAHVHPAGQGRARDARGLHRRPVRGRGARRLVAGVLVRDMLADSAGALSPSPGPGPAASAVAFVAEVVISCHPDDRRADRVQPRDGWRGSPVSAPACWWPLHHLRGAALRHEHEPGADVGSGFWAHDWTALWIYFIAPPLGMLLAAELYLRRTAATNLLRQAASSEREALHLLRDAEAAVETFSRGRPHYTRDTDPLRPLALVEGAEG